MAHILYIELSVNRDTQCAHVYYSMSPIEMLASCMLTYMHIFQVKFHLGGRFVDM